MSRYDYYGYFKPTKARETKDGIKARSKRGAFAKSWWATRWIKALERLVDKGRLSRGRTYARKGQVTAIDETKTGIRAKVQGSTRRPYKVSIEVEPLTDAQWETVLDLLAEQAIFTVQLLAGEMPDEIEDAFTATGVSLFPDSRNQLFTDCSCPDWANPCKHVAAVHYILGEQFDEDPFMIFRLRGRDQEAIIAGLRTRRAGEDANDFEDDAPEPAIPLADTLADFWGSPHGGTVIKTSVRKPAVEYPILKRLGQPAFLREDIIATLGPAYRAITKRAIATVEADT